jgi:hypothetical protein
MQKTLITNKYTKRVLLDPDREQFTPPKTTQYTVNSTLSSTAKCNPSVTVTKKFSVKMTQQGRNM